jgi:hypothetical protein
MPKLVIVDEKKASDGSMCGKDDVESVESTCGQEVRPHFEEGQAKGAR